MFPSEVLVMIFTHLDAESLEHSKHVCKKWKNLVETSVHLWKSLIRRFCYQNKSMEKMLKLSVYRDIISDATKLEILYRKLLKVEQNVISSNYRVRTINCLEVEVGGAKVERDSEWSRNHNYKGVYDMVLDNNILVASVYDTIQIWDMSKYVIKNIIPSKVLDESCSKTTCFTLFHEKFLVCGTQNGFLKLYSLQSCQIISKTKQNSNYITDVVANDDTVASIDWYGEVILWKLIQDGNSCELQCVTPEKQFIVPRILASREHERLMDFTSDYLVTTYRTHLTCYKKTEFFRSFPAPTDIFCINIQGDKLAFGCKGEGRIPEETEADSMLSASSGILNLDPDKFPAVVYFKTRDNDPIISISFNSNNIITLGDTNGELHIVNVEKLKFPDKGEVTVNLADNENEWGVEFITTIRTHEYRSFVWACKTDCYRMFSGDESGKIIVHDYLMFED